MNVKNKKLKKLKAAFDFEALTNLYNKNFTFTRKGGKLYSLDKDDKHIFQKYEWATYMNHHYFVKLPKSDKIIVIDSVEVNMCYWMRNGWRSSNNLRKIFVAAKPNDYKEPHLCHQPKQYEISEMIEHAKRDIEHSIENEGKAQRWQYEQLETLQAAQKKFMGGKKND